MVHGQRQERRELVVLGVKMEAHVVEGIVQPQSVAGCQGSGAAGRNAVDERHMTGAHDNPHGVKECGDQALVEEEP